MIRTMSPSAIRKMLRWINDEAWREEQLAKKPLHHRHHYLKSIADGRFTTAGDPRGPRNLSQESLTKMGEASRRRWTKPKTDEHRAKIRTKFHERSQARVTCIVPGCDRPRHIYVSRNMMDDRCLLHIREKGMMMRYGITMDQFLEMLERQGGGCYFCGATRSAKGRANSDAFGSILFVDHDHACGCGAGRRRVSEPEPCGKCVRGLLCSTCNRMLGALETNPAGLPKILNYIGYKP